MEWYVKHNGGWVEKDPSKLNYGDVRRHSKKHIRKLYNKLQQGYYVDETHFVRGDPPEVYDIRVVMEINHILVANGYGNRKEKIWEEEDLIDFTFDNFDDFYYIWKNFCNLISPTYYLKHIKKRV